MSSSAFTPTQTQITNNVPTNVPIVEAGQDYTGAITGGGSATYNYVSRKWRRVGDSVQVNWYFSVTATGSGASNLLLPLPTGMTVDFTKTSNGQIIGSGYRLSGGTKNAAFTPRVVTGTSNAFVIETSSGSILTGSAVVSGEEFNLTATIAISEWAGSGTTTLATRAVEEYAAATSGTWDANATAAQTIYGLEGAPITGAISAASRNKVVRFQSPILPTDKIFLEIYNLNGNPGWVSHTDIGFGLVQQLNQVYGAQINPVNAGFNTDCIVYFYQFYCPASNAYGGAGQQWSNGLRWRLRKVSGGAQVGYPVSSRNIVGDTSGTVVPTGMIGETLKSNPASAVAVAATTVFTNITSLTLTPGVWAVTAAVQISTGTISGWNYYQVNISTSSGINDSNNNGGTFSATPSNTSGFVQSAGTRFFNVSVNTPIYLVGRIDYSSQSGSVWQINSTLQAVRIA